MRRRRMRVAARAVRKAVRVEAWRSPSGVPRGGWIIREPWMEGGVVLVILVVLVAVVGRERLVRLLTSVVVLLVVLVVELEDEESDGLTAAAAPATVTTFIPVLFEDREGMKRVVVPSLSLIDVRSGWLVAHAQSSWVPVL